MCIAQVVGHWNAFAVRVTSGRAFMGTSRLGRGTPRFSDRQRSVAAVLFPHIHHLRHLHDTSLFSSQLLSQSTAVSPIMQQCYVSPVFYAHIINWLALASPLHSITDAFSFQASILPNPRRGRDTCCSFSYIFSSRILSITQRPCMFQ